MKFCAAGPHRGGTSLLWGAKNRDAAPRSIRISCRSCASAITRVAMKEDVVKDQNRSVRRSRSARSGRRLASLKAARASHPYSAEVIESLERRLLLRAPTTSIAQQLLTKPPPDLHASANRDPHLVQNTNPQHGPAKPGPNDHAPPFQHDLPPSNPQR